MKTIESINPRDRNLLMILLVAIIFFLSYTFVISPALEKTAMLQPNIQAMEDEIANAEKIVAELDSLEKQENDLKNKMIEKYSGFLIDLKQENILYSMDTLILDSALNVTSYLPSPLVVSQVVIEEGVYADQGYPLQGLADRIYPMGTEDRVLGQQGTESVGPVDSQDMIPCRSVTIDFETATYEKVRVFMMSLEQMKKTVLVKNIALSKDEGGIRGQLILDFYSIPAFDSTQRASLDFVPVIPKGKINPFI